MKLKLLLGVLVVFVGTVILSDAPAYAKSGSCYFGSGTCSVSGAGDYGTNDVFTGRSSSGKGSAIPSSVDTKKEFIDYIVDRYGGGKHNKTGASFVIQEMRGSTSRPSDANVDDWVARMNNPDVTVSKDKDYHVKKTSWYDPGENDVFYDSYDVYRDVVEIKYKGGVIARIEYLCGNLVAGVVELPKKADWTISSTSKVTPSPTVNAGQTITWTHTMTNSGPDTTDKAINWAIEGNNSVLIAQSGTWGNGQGKNKSFTKTYTYTTTAADIGKNLCQRLHVNPWTAAGAVGATGWACTTVVSVFTLTPKVTVPSGNVVDSGSVIPTVTATVDKAGDTTPPVDWEFSKIIVAPGGSIPTAMTDNTNTSKVHFGNTWTSIATGRQSFVGVTTQVGLLNNVEIDELPAGTRICWALSIKPPSNTYAGWRHSAPVCLKIGKSPKLHVLGGDVRVRGTIGTSTTVLKRGSPKVSRIFGSWVEYGAFSVGLNSGLASGAGTRNGSEKLTPVQWSDLTFANVDPSGSAVFGKYSTLPGFPPVPEIADYFTDRVDASLTLGTLTSSTPSGIYRVNGPLTIDPNVQIAKGKSIIIVATGQTVRINKNIVYEDTGISSLSDIPQLVIIASKIIINESVTNVDAWLMASDWINTCSAVAIPAGVITTDPGTSVLTVNACNLPLTVNGPVATGKLYLYRTGGSGPASDAGNSAETFNFRPDASLWAYYYGLKNLQPTTSSISGLPPRF